MKRLIVHPIVWEQLCGILKAPKGFLKFPMEFPSTQLPYVIKDGCVFEEGEFAHTISICHPWGSTNVNSQNMVKVQSGMLNVSGTWSLICNDSMIIITIIIIVCLVLNV